MKRVFAAVALLASSALCPSVWGSAITLTTPTATYSQPGFGVGFASDGTIDSSTGWAVDPNEGSIESAVFDVLGTPVTGLPETEYTFTLYQLFASPAFHTLGDFRLSVTSDPSPTATGPATWTYLSDVTFSDDASETPLSIDPVTGEIVLPKSPVPVPTYSVPATATYTVTGRTALQNVTGFRLEVIPYGAPPDFGPGRQPTNGNLVLSEIQVAATPVPVPASLWGGLVLLSGFGASRYRRFRTA
jgi:hypothetical protein